MAASVRFPGTGAGHGPTMSETDSTGYGDSPDTTDPDGAAAERQAQQGETADTSLTTDEDAQREDSVMRPGNEAD